MRSINRREFLQDSAALAAALAAVGGVGNHLEAAEKTKTAKKKSASDQLHVAVIGVHGRGREHVSKFSGHPETVVATICDADSAVIGPAMRFAEKAQGKAPKFEQDLRRVLDDKSIDVVTIAMPNHWHSLAAIWAMQSGKDVYVEKPVSHNVTEGRRLVETARKCGRICQAGTQYRSSGAMKEAIEFMRAGKLGHIKVSRGLCYKPRGSIGKAEGEQKIPATVDYDLWCGPAPKKPLARKRLHYDWHWTWDYGNGDLGNQGVHEMDLARWGLGKEGLCKSVISVGGRFGYVDDGETANTQICVYDFGDCELIFEVRGLPTKDLLGAKIGNIFYGTEGYIVRAKGVTAFDPKGKVIKTFTGQGGADHFDNFVQAVHSRKHENLNADVLEGHLSSALCHLGNISYRLGALQPFSKESRAFGDDKEAYETLSRMEEHLKGNNVPLDQTSYHVGPKLAFDSKTETFVNDPEADKYLTRKYRAPFTVPEKA
jgi:predicted dehydrogenase